MRNVRHDYVPVGHILVSTEQEPYSLARLLLRRGRSLIGVREGAGGLAASSGWAREVARATRIAAAYARARRRARVVRFPALGHVAVRVVAGHKVFDLIGGRVTTVLHDTTSEASMLAIVDQLHRAAACPLAPGLLGVDLQRRTYVEEYVDGRRLRGLDARLQRLPQYLPLLTQVVSALPPRTVPLASYASTRADEVRVRAARLARSTSTRHATEALAAIESFTDSVLARLVAHGDLPVHLTLSHGDLHGGNVCLTAAGPRIIDWGLSDLRTLSYDLYHRVFRTAWLRDMPTLPAPRVAAAVDAFAAQLARDTAVDIAGWRQAEDAYRLLFYLECLSPKKPGAPSSDAAVVLRRQRRQVLGFRALEDHHGAVRALG